MSKIIITCAVTGSIHTPSMTPHLPITAEEITDEAVAAAQAGASVLHLHARDPINGRPTALAEHFMAFLPRIKQASDAVVNITTGGSATMTLDDRLAAPMVAEPEMCSLNMGSMNFALYPAAQKISDWKYDWEKPFLEGSEDLVFKNTPRDIAYVVTEMGEKRGARFEFECYDLSHLYMLRHFADRGLVKPPVFLQTIFGAMGGIGPDIDNLIFMKRTADRLLGDDFVWSVLGAGRFQFGLVTTGAIMGSHVRVGLEDNLYIGPGELAKSNADQVAKIKRILGELSLEAATPDETRTMLGLKGGDRVKF